MRYFYYRTIVFSMNDAVNGRVSTERLVGERCTKYEYPCPNYTMTLINFLSIESKGRCCRAPIASS